MALDSLDHGPGLANVPKDEWAGNKNTDATTALDRMMKNKEFHDKTLSFLKARIKMSQDAMTRFYPRWQVAEKKIQAYVPVKDYEEQMDAWKKASEDPENPKYRGPRLLNVVVPYAFATLQTIVTFQLQAFAGQRPMFGLTSNSGEAEQGRVAMETLLQWNVDQDRMVKEIYQWLTDGQAYGVGVLRTAWLSTKSLRTVWTNGEKKREERKVFQGTRTTAIDPFMFLPDPRVPMSKVAEQGEFVFFRTWLGKHELLAMEADGLIKGVGRTPDLPSSRTEDLWSQSNRGMMSMGEEVPGKERAGDGSVTSFYEVVQGTVTVIPQEMGLGPGVRPEKWIFTILNNSRVVQAEPFDADYDTHPVSVIEPYTQGYSFGQPGMADMVGPLQDVLSWFVNSHIRNVRTAINNMFIADPSKVEVNDLLNPAPGKVIRLKRTAYGGDVREALQQLQVADVTRGHMADLQLFMRLADGLTGVTDNLRGLQDSGGRKTATEVRTTSEAGASRMASQARLIAAQGIAPLVNMFLCNYLQYGDPDFITQIIGTMAGNAPQITPDQISSNFYYQVNDGTLPIDRVMMIDIWKEIFMGVAQDPNLNAEYDSGKIFQHVAMLSGAKNITAFKRPPPLPGMQVPGSPEQIAGGVQAGNLVPAPPEMAQMMGLRR